jgi:transposase
MRHKRNKPKPSSPTSAQPVPGSEDQVVGRRFVRHIEEQLRQLHQHPAHGNRDIFLDHLVVGHLIAFFNPGVRGLRTIEDILKKPRVRKRFGIPRLPKSTVSDAQNIFDAQLLLPLIESLRERAGIQEHDSRLDRVTRQLVAVDSSFFTVAPRIAWAVFNGSGKGNVRLHVQFNVFDGVPDHVTLTDGQGSETNELRKSLRKDCFYVGDRGFQEYGLLKDILDAGSDFLVRLRKSARYDVLEELPLTAADQEVRIARDAIVQLGWRDNQTPDLPGLRWVEVTFTNRQGNEETMFLVTNRLDLPAWMIALLYQHRWQVELFFRWLKCMAHFEHFFSESLNGMTLQVYVTMIGLLLIAIETGAKPSKYDYALLSVAMSGLLTMEEALEVAATRRAERKRAAEWQKAYNARKKNAQ